MPPLPWARIHPVNLERDRERLAAQSSVVQEDGYFERRRFVELTMGWSGDGLGGYIERHLGFHAAFQRTAAYRYQTRALAYGIAQDTITALERACGVGTVTFFIKGERNPINVEDGTDAYNIGDNVEMIVSDNIETNANFVGPLANIRSMFHESIAIPFVEDWEARALESGHFSGKNIFPEDAPVTSPTTPRTPTRRSQPARQITPHTPTRPSQSVTKNTPTRPSQSVSKPHTPSYITRQPQYEQHGNNTASLHSPPRAVTINTTQTLRWAQSVSGAAGSSTATPSSVSSVSSMSTLRRNPSIFIPCPAIDLLTDLNFLGTTNLDRLREIMSRYPQDEWSLYIEASLGFDESDSEELVRRLINDN
ncbi:hypothetical protein BD410DRAFT_846791 [Rickenella mellea]|uniref:Uncharacterized protein n=1 Tax=Rickenella mellea TaxID=50990 RepID=A0A4Y7PFK4_9AGAM|nr:hypothetical protein BD410DRAFT_846791 [Rickenella mellea]